MGQGGLFMEKGANINSGAWALRVKGLLNQELAKGVYRKFRMMMRKLKLGTNTKPNPKQGNGKTHSPWNQQHGISHVWKIEKMNLSSN